MLRSSGSQGSDRSDREAARCWSALGLELGTDRRCLDRWSRRLLTAAQLCVLAHHRRRGPSPPHRAGSGRRLGPLPPAPPAQSWGVLGGLRPLAGTYCAISGRSHWARVRLSRRAATAVARLARSPPAPPGAPTPPPPRPWWWLLWWLVVGWWGSARKGGGHHGALRRESLNSGSASSTCVLTSFVCPGKRTPGGCLLSLPPPCVLAANAVALAPRTRLFSPAFG